MVVVGAPLVKDPHRRNADVAEGADEVRGHDGVADGDAHVRHTLEELVELADEDGDAEVSKLVRWCGVASAEE